MMEAHVQVNDLDSPDCPMTIATSRGYLHYPPPAIHFTPASTASQSKHSLTSHPPFVPLPSWFWPVLTTAGSDLGVFQTDPLVASAAPVNHPPSNFAEDSVSPILATELDIDTSGPSQLTELQFPDSSSPAPMDISPRPLHDEVFGDSNDASTSGREPLEEGEILELSDTSNGDASQNRTRTQNHGRGSPTVVGAPWDVGGPVSQPLFTAPTEIASPSLADGSTQRVPIVPVARRQDSGSTAGPGNWPINAFPSLNSQILAGGGAGGMPPFQNFLPVGDYTGWELPFLHGWVQGQQAQAGIGPSGFSTGGGVQQSVQEQQQQNAAVSVASVAMAAAMAAARAAARAGAGMVGAASAGLGAGIGAQIGVGKSCLYYSSLKGWLRGTKELQ